MNRRTREEWQALFEAQAASGQTAAGYCRAQGVCPKYFSLRRRQLMGSEGGAKATRARSAFVAVRVPQAVAEPLTVLLRDGVQLRLSDSISAGWLAELLGALRE